MEPHAVPRQVWQHLVTVQVIVELDGLQQQQQLIEVK